MIGETLYTESSLGDAQTRLQIKIWILETACNEIAIIIVLKISFAYEI